MVHLVNRCGHIYFLANTWICSAMSESPVTYWLQRHERGAEWTVWALYEGCRSRIALETHPAHRIRYHVEEELGVDLSDEDWARMGWTQELAEQTRAEEPPPAPWAPSRSTYPPLAPREMEEEGRLEAAALRCMIPGDTPWLLRMKAAARAKAGDSKSKPRS